MKAIVYQNFGSPDTLRCEEIAKPTPGDNEVLIKTRAASINPLDWKLMKLPIIGRGTSANSKTWFGGSSWSVIPKLVASELNAKSARKRLRTPASTRESALPETPWAEVHEMARAPILTRVTKANQQAEADAILAALESTRWNRKQAAVLLQIDYKALLYKLKKLGLDDKSAAVDPPFAVHHL